MSKREIEAHALSVLGRVSPASLHTPAPVPVLSFFDFKLQKLFGIRTGNSDRLPFGYEGISFPPKPDGHPELLLATPVYLALCEDQPRARFTAAHECAHGILHAAQLCTYVVEGRLPALFRRTSVPAYRDPEWQANYWAGVFLMPTQAVLAYVQRCGADPSGVAKTFWVSYSAAETRLSYMRGGGVLI